MWRKERAASLCVTGYVYAPGGSATEAEARVIVGERDVRVVAVGPRVWHRGIHGVMVPTSPRPFDRIPMTWAGAFGGSVRRPWTVQRIDGDAVMVPGHEAHFPDNPRGKGFYLSAEQAEDQPLPLLEDPEARVASVSDWPRPRSAWTKT